MLAPFLAVTLALPSSGGLTLAELQAGLWLTGWGMTAFRFGNETAQVRYWGGAFFGARAVIRRFVDLGVRIEVLDGGAVVDGSVSIWLRRRLGLTFGLQGGRGAFSDSPIVYDRAGGEVAVSCWIRQGLALSLSYAPSWVRGPAFGQSSSIGHLLTLTTTWRPQVRSQLPPVGDTRP